MILPAQGRVSRKLPEGVLIDEEDQPLIESFNNWFISVRGDVYSQKWENKKSITYKLHRIIMNAPKDKVVDHINGNQLDNRKSNLRICTQKENSRNCKLSKNNTSGVNGVCWDKARNKWVARIKVDYKNIQLGRFNDFKEAVRVRHEAEIKYFGDFSPIRSRA